jgi:hypothetical protein
MSRRNFTRNQLEQIVDRATIDGTVYCQGCGLALKKGAWEVDHIIPEAIRPEADKRVKITIAEGQVLGRECCHRGADGKTARDVKQIAKAKRQNAKDIGIAAAPRQKIGGRSFPVADKPAKASKPLPPRRSIFTGQPIVQMYRKAPIDIEERDYD